MHQNKLYPIATHPIISTGSELFWENLSQKRPTTLIRSQHYRWILETHQPSSRSGPHWPLHHPDTLPQHGHVQFQRKYNMFPNRQGLIFGIWTKHDKTKLSSPCARCSGITLYEDARRTSIVPMGKSENRVPPIPMDWLYPHFPNLKCPFGDAPYFQANHDKPILCCQQFPTLPRSFTAAAGSYRISPELITRHWKQLGIKWNHGGPRIYITHKYP
jgi:hypothetical protein